MCSQLVKGLLQILTVSIRSITYRSYTVLLLFSDWVASLARTAGAVSSTIKCTTSSHSMETRC